MAPRPTARAPVPKYLKFAPMVGAAPADVLDEAVPVPEATAAVPVDEAVEVEAALVVATTATNVEGSFPPQLAFWFFAQVAWEAASPTLARLQLVKICWQIKVGMVVV